MLNFGPEERKIYKSVCNVSERLMYRSVNVSDWESHVRELIYRRVQYLCTRYLKEYLMAIVFMTLKVVPIQVEYEPEALIAFSTTLTIYLQHAQFRASLGEMMYICHG